MEQRIQRIFCGKGNTESISDQYSAGVWLWLRLLLRNRAYDGQGSRLQKGRYHVSSNDTPEKEFRYADEIGGIINLDDITHIESVEKALGKIPEVISCRYNPGGVFKISNGIMDNPGDAKYGMTTEQIFDAFRILKSKGAKEFGIHAFLASNTVTNDYYPMLAKVMFELA